MAKNISLLGADYPNVPAVQLPQTGGGTATFYDLDDYFEETTWTPNINGITYSGLTDNVAVRSGNIVTCRAYFKIETAGSGSAYINGACFPAFGKTKHFGSGTWLDNTNDNAGIIVAGANTNAWIINTTTGQHMSFSNYTGRYVYICYTYTLAD